MQEVEEQVQGTWMPKRAVLMVEQGRTITINKGQYKKLSDCFAFAAGR